MPFLFDTRRARSCEVPGRVGLSEDEVSAGRT
jgi:hypothetical protein